MAFRNFTQIISINLQGSTFYSWRLLIFAKTTHQTTSIMKI